MPTSSDSSSSRPLLAILGAGPVGLEAALAAAEAGLDFRLYEASPEVAGNVAEWAHVKAFTPWSFNVSPRARRALQEAGIEVPDGDAVPSGAELREHLFVPLAGLPALAPRLELGARVLTIGREGLTKNQEIGTAVRRERPFRLLVERDGRETIEHADRVIDCTGSYAVPNSLGDGGIPAPGERSLNGRIDYRLPDFRAAEQEWSGRTTLLAGSGHSAQTAARYLADLAERTPDTKIVWVLRRPRPDFRENEPDPLAERKELHRRAAALAYGACPHLTALTGRVVESLEETPDGRVRVTLRRLHGGEGNSAEDGGTETVEVDRIIALTGTVGDASLYRQLQVHECYATSGPMKLAAALLGAAGAGGDCLDQESHGAETLLNPEPGFFILGSKSYGRNNTFLMRLGWEQVDEVMTLL